MQQIITNEYLRNIAPDYSYAEVTSLLLHDRKVNKWFNLFTVVELVPLEQEPSSHIAGSDPNIPADREEIDKDYTIYLVRQTDLTVNSAITLFNNPEKDFLLSIPPKVSCDVKLLPQALLESEPGSGYPIVIDKQTDHIIGTVLPYRHTDFRVWLKIDRGKKWYSLFSEAQKKMIIEKSGQLTMKHLNFDLAKMTEHLGNIYLCACNPYLREYDLSLLDYDRDLLISLEERDGKTIIGNRLVLEEDRAGNPGFNIERIISNRLERIELPHFPAKLITKIYDANGYLIENHTGVWTNLSIGMQVQTAVLNLTVQDGDKTKTMEIPKYSAEKPIAIGKYDTTLTWYLKNQQRAREIQDLEDRKEFIFFSGSDADKEKARTIVGEIINKANKRCIFLDPYFGAVDLYFVYILKSVSIPVQIISSAAHLGNKIAKDVSTTHADLLLKELDEFRQKFTYQRIECKVLKGSNKSPLHDRYIVIDEAVYLLGSSFNEFGSRATTLVKVVAPEQMIRKALDWWADAENETIEDYVTKKKYSK